MMTAPSRIVIVHPYFAPRRMASLCCFTIWGARTLVSGANTGLHSAQSTELHINKNGTMVSGRAGFERLSRTIPIATHADLRLCVLD